MCEFDANDIGLIELTEDINLPYLSLIDQNTYKNILNKNGLILGWGSTDLKNTSPDVLQQGKVIIKEFSKNVVSLNSDKFYKTYLMSFYNDTGQIVNSGDSGGPLFFYQSGKYYLTGISVGGDFISDLTNYKAFYKNVYEYLPWIQKVTGIKPGQGTFAGKPPDWITPTITPKSTLTPTPVNRDR